ncbi:MAG: Methyltransferase type 11 [Acidobacteria bacterium]|nr:Methyltransferase type 11 [Acidobacteriota bacterium]
MALKEAQLSVGAYQNTDRGDRAAPGRANRVHCFLVLLLDKLEQIVRSDELPAGDNLLDFGCGNNPYKALFSEKFTNYISADLPGNERAEVIIRSDGTLPSFDDSFDCVLSSQVLEHVIDPALYLREAFRVLKPGASLILSTHGWWAYHPDPCDYWRWTIDGLRLQLETAGFEIVVTKGVFGPESVALQLLQDSTFYRLPRLMQPAYTWFFQRVIWLIERRSPDKLSEDASIYIVRARKPM